jgi:hypothetical protein
MCRTLSSLNPSSISACGLSEIYATALGEMILSKKKALEGFLYSDRAVLLVLDVFRYAEHLLRCTQAPIRPVGRDKRNCTGRDDSIKEKSVGGVPVLRSRCPFGSRRV